VVFFSFFKKAKLSVHDAERKYSNAVMMAAPTELRTKVPIVAIDDQPFHPENNLRNAGFNIVVKQDIYHIQEIEPFAIVLCDVNDVGNSLNKQSQGAFVIQEILNNYPDKVVIAYTAGSLNLANVRTAKQIAHAYLKKDASIEDWRDVLDGHIKRILNPVEKWKALRLRLIEKGIELDDLIKLEQTYLENIALGAVPTREAMEKALRGNAASPWGQELISFIRSKAFDITFTLATKAILGGT